MKKLLPLIFISAGIIGLSACGQTGDLYLPKEDKPASSGSTMLVSGSTTKKDSSTNQNSSIFPIPSPTNNSSSNSQSTSSNSATDATKQDETSTNEQNQQSTNINQDTSKQKTDNTKNYTLTKQIPNNSIPSSSTIQNYPQVNNQSSSQTTKVDNDPTPPAKNYNPTSSQLINSGDNFAFDKDIQESSEAGGTPS
ncbi:MULTISPECIES: LPS translocon maturation chaperone LptM [unclassified Francisella]|uniref:LPS translocon maturation chaperone LptM n=1 Tax=unclassified Francisella TaxID=2610885 RepID=UPI002E310CEF|nr:MULTISPECIES: lipoprotein [unclassified Francisella]MED7818757.1 lipoprotein [Francisella sp. 19S2-4]MED7829526.1 lipoprotein [Francisella sp. 19S2-10]